MRSALLAACCVMTAALALVACGSGDDAPASAAAPTTPTTPTTPTATVTTISGSAVKGPVANATVTVKNAATGASLASTTTNATGAYSVAVPTFIGDVIVEVSGGSYTDEATGAATALAGPMRVVVTANGGNVTGVVTPLTTMAYSTSFGSGATVTASAFNTAATNLAAQFQLTGVNLATTVPTVTGTTNAYGNVLRGLSKYLQTQSISLQTLTSTTFTAAQLALFSTNYTAAYAAINPGSPVVFNFTATGFSVSGTGVGGGTGTCGINVTGTVTSQGFTVPLNLNYCVSGIATGSCSADNATLNQSVAGQGGVAGAANLKYTYTPSCAAGAFTIALQ